MNPQIYGEYLKTRVTFAVVRIPHGPGETFARGEIPSAAYKKRAAPFRSGPQAHLLEATPGFEPGVKALQASALPLGHVAVMG